MSQVRCKNTKTPTNAFNYSNKPENCFEAKQMSSSTTSSNTKTLSVIRIDINNNKHYDTSESYTGRKIIVTRADKTNKEDNKEFNLMNIMEDVKNLKYKVNELKARSITQTDLRATEQILNHMVEKKILMIKNELEGKITNINKLSLVTNKDNENRITDLTEKMDKYSIMQKENNINLNKQIEDFKMRISTLSNEFLETKRDVNDIKENTYINSTIEKNLNIEIESLNKKIDELHKNKNNLNNFIENTENNIKEIKNEMNEKIIKSVELIKTKNIKEVREQLVKLDNNDQLITETKKNLLKEEITDQIAKLSSSLERENKENKSIINELQTQYKDIQEQLYSIKTNYEKNKSPLQTTNDTINEEMLQYSPMKYEKTVVEKDSNTIKVQIESIKNHLKDSLHYSRSLLSLHSRSCLVQSRSLLSALDTHWAVQTGSSSLTMKRCPTCLDHHC